MSFTFNGTNCETYGMYVEKYPARPFPTRKQTTYNILGKSGDLIVDHGGYGNVTMSYEVFVKGFHTNLSQIANWLLYQPSGYAKLTDTYDTGIYREARVIGAGEFLNSLNKFGKATLQFDCKPQRFPDPDETLSINVNGTGTYTNVNGLIGDKPLVVVSGITSSENITLKMYTLIGGTQTGIETIYAPYASVSKISFDFEMETVYKTDAFNHPTIAFTDETSGGWDFGYGRTMQLLSSKTGSTATATVYSRRYYL